MSDEDGPKDIIEGRPQFDYWSRVMAEELDPTVSILQGPKPPLGFMTDGCTHCPDKGPTGEPLWLACGWHDWAYDARCTDIPDTEEGRRQADNLLWANLKTLGLDDVLADDIWAAVRVAAAGHFKAPRAS